MWRDNLRTHAFGTEVHMFCYILGDLLMSVATMKEFVNLELLLMYKTYVMHSPYPVFMHIYQVEFIYDYY